MRKIGELSSEVQAGVFSAALRVREMENDVESEDDGTFSVWVHDDDQLAAASALMEQFRATPDAPEWYAAVPAARRMQKEEERRDKRRASHVITRERIGYERSFGGFASVPLIVAIICVALTLVAGEVGLLPSGWVPTAENAMDAEAVRAFEKKFEMQQRLSMTKWKMELSDADTVRYAEAVERHGAGSMAVRRLFFDATLPEVRHGEVWRLFASAFIHFGIIHLVFNLMWFRDLGGFVQHRFGAAYLVALCAVLAAVSSYAQLLWSGPSGGGLSGVVYGLFGFMWMRGKFDRTALYQMNPQVVQMMMVWFFLCFTPLLPNIGNAAHTSGLLLGGLIGAVSGKLASRRRAM